MGDLPEWFDAGALRDDELRLALLDAGHTEQWLEHHQDGRVAELCRLPAFITRAYTSSWLERCQRETREPLDAGRAQCFSLGLIHAQQGLIGSVRLHRYAASAFFSFWVGPAQQGRGFGARASRLVTRVLAPRLQLDLLFTATYPSNLPSERALERSGWQRLALPATPSPHGAAFWHWPGSGSHPNESALTVLLLAVGSDLRVARTSVAADRCSSRDCANAVE